jgi:protein-disulfide isomerase
VSRGRAIGSRAARRRPGGDAISAARYHLLMKKVLALTAALTLIACSPSRAQQAGSDTAARIGDRVVTLKELEDRWAASDPAQHAEATQKLYEGRRAALDDIIAETLIGQAAKAKGMTPEAYEEAEIGKRVKPVTDADVVAFYQANANQMQGRTLDSVSPAINRYLQDQQRSSARQQLVNELRKSGPPVRVLFEAPRTKVDVAATDPALGAASAPVTIVEFSDFQCPFCQRATPTLKQLRQAYGDKIRIVWKDFPLTQIHPQAFKAAEAARCAEEQGKFWEFHDRLFGNQQALQPDDLKKHAADLGLDSAKFGSCLDSSKYAERVRDGVAAGTRLGVNSTPTVYVNGRVVQGAQPFEVFSGIIDEELESRK